MRAVRFGSYWIESTLAGDAVLVAAEVDQPVAPLVAAAAMPRRDLALVVAAAGLASSGAAATSRGFAPGVSSAKSLTVAPRRPGVVGLYSRMPMIAALSCQLVSLISLLTTDD